MNFYIKNIYLKLKNYYYLKYINIFNFKHLNSIRIGNSILLEQKVYFTGKGSIEIGDNIQFGYRMGGHRKGAIEIQARSRKAKILIKKNVVINNNLFICANQYIEIGEDCIIGRDCEFLDFDGHGIEPSKRRSKTGLQEPIIIRDNVWFGNGCKVLRGSTIGENCIVAAGAVVKGKFEDNCIIGGVPAKVIKKIKSA